MGSIKKITINRLTDRFVEIDTEQYIEMEGQEIKLDIPKHSAAFFNTTTGRKNLEDSDLPENIREAVLAMWGEATTE